MLSGFSSFTWFSQKTHPKVRQTFRDLKKAPTAQLSIEKVVKLLERDLKPFLISPRAMVSAPGSGLLGPAPRVARPAAALPARPGRNGRVGWGLRVFSAQKRGSKTRAP